MKLSRFEAVSSETSDKYVFTTMPRIHGEKWLPIFQKEQLIVSRATNKALGSPTLLGDLLPPRFNHEE